MIDSFRTKITFVTNQQLGDAANNTNSCAYGSTGSINLINAPAQRPGYTFTGWTVTDWTDGAINNNNNNDG